MNTLMHRTFSTYTHPPNTIYTTNERYHRWLHADRDRYIRFHKPHHIFTAPFCWTSHAVHPVEMLLQSVGAMVGPVFLGMNLRTLWVWLAVRQWQGVLDHTGYELPIDPIGWIPGVGGTKFHDNHHKVLRVLITLIN